MQRLCSKLSPSATLGGGLVFGVNALMGFCFNFICASASFDAKSLNAPDSGFLDDHGCGFGQQCGKAYTCRTSRKLHGTSFEADPTWFKCGQYHAG